MGRRTPAYLGVRNGRQLDGHCTHSSKIGCLPRVPGAASVARWLVRDLLAVRQAAPASGHQAAASVRGLNTGFSQVQIPHGGGKVRWLPDGCGHRLGTAILGSGRTAPAGRTPAVACGPQFWWRVAEALRVSRGSQNKQKAPTPCPRPPLLSLLSRGPLHGGGTTRPEGVSLVTDLSLAKLQRGERSTENRDFRPGRVWRAETGQGKGLAATAV